MREILFRGKRIDNGEWAEGLLSTEYYQNHGIVLICPSEDEAYKVDPETVGQYTGLTANDKKMFEGDIIKHYFSQRFSPSVGQVMYDDEHCKWVKKDVYNDTWEIHKGCIYEVIGNIHDNPELLEDKS